MISYEIKSPTEARKSFFKILEEVVENNQIFLINRRDGENVALISESELRNLLETVYLLKSPVNARRLFDAIAESKTGQISPQPLEELKQELNIEQKEEKT